MRLGKLADECDVVDHLRGDPPAHVADDHRVAQAEAEEVRRVGAGIQARDHEQLQGREHDRALVAARGGERAVARECGFDPARLRLVAAVAELEPGGPADAVWFVLLVAHRVCLLVGIV